MAKRKEQLDELLHVSSLGGFSRRSCAYRIPTCLCCDQRLRGEVRQSQDSDDEHFTPCFSRPRRTVCCQSERRPLQSSCRQCRRDRRGETKMRLPGRSSIGASGRWLRAECDHQSRAKQITKRGGQATPPLPPLLQARADRTAARRARAAALTERHDNNRKSEISLARARSGAHVMRETTLSSHRGRQATNNHA